MSAYHELGPNLSPITRAILERRGAARNGLHGPPAALRELLLQAGLEPHEPVLSFEEHYGGLQVPEGDSDALALVVGPYACLHSGFSNFPRSDTEQVSRHLVPVILGWDDMVYYLGIDGRGWQEWSDGRMSALAQNSGQLLTRALLWRVLIAGGPTFDDGGFGATLAARRGLPSIDEEYGGEQWWGTPDSVIVQFEHHSLGVCTYYTSDHSTETDSPVG